MGSGCRGLRHGGGGRTPMKGPTGPVLAVEVAAEAAAVAAQAAGAGVMAAMRVGVVEMGSTGAEGGAMGGCRPDGTRAVEVAADGGPARGRPAASMGSGSSWQMLGVPMLSCWGTIVSRVVVLGAIHAVGAMSKRAGRAGATAAGCC